jgi:hypothetical protein
LQLTLALAVRAALAAVAAELAEPAAYSARRPFLFRGQAAVAAVPLQPQHSAAALRGLGEGMEETASRTIIMELAGVALADTPEMAGPAALQG